jgi:hypothetical protein
MRRPSKSVRKRLRKERNHHDQSIQAYKSRIAFDLPADIDRVSGNRAC